MRVAVLSVHTSPLAQPGTGDAGGMNVYVLQSALHMARRGVEVEIFTRATSSADPPVVRVAPGVLVRNIIAGPFEGLDKYDLPTQLCAFTAGVLRAEANYDRSYDPAAGARQVGAVLLATPRAEALAVEAAELMEQHGFVQATVVADLAGRDRVVAARWKP